MNNDELMHYGVLGMKWGVRRYRNADGSLTKLGKKKSKRYEKRLDKNQQRQAKMENGINKIYATNKGKNMLGTYGEWGQYYRNRSKMNLKKIEKIDPKLATKLNKKYSKMLNKVYLQDFTMKELRSIQKQPDKLDEKAMKFFKQEETRILLNTNIKDAAKKEMNRRINDQLQQQTQDQINMQIQQQIQQQINMQIQQQINMQIQQQIDMQMQQKMAMQTMGMM